MLEKNKQYEAVVTDYTAEGQGVAHVEGCAVFVPNAIAGEKYQIRIEKVGKTWAAGKIVEILEKSPHRVQRECPISASCGGCDFWHMDYEEETRLKAERVRSTLNRIGGENLEEVPILSAPTCKAYRNKAQYPVASQKGRVYAGFFKAGTHTVVENDRCLILPDETEQVRQIVIDYVNHYRITAYDEVAHKGLLRHIYVRRGAVSGQVLVCLVINGRKLPHTEDLIQRLQAVKGFTSLVLSVNTKDTNTVLGDEEIVLYGPGYIEDTLCGLTFRLSPRSFYQVNHHQAQRLYEAAIRQAEITKKDLVLDLYCGVGTITLAMAKAAGKVIGVEVVEQAVVDAKENARRNGIENAEFFCADAGKAALKLEQEGIRPDVVVVDPPRKGLNSDAIEALHRMSPRRIVYVSCDPATLARDVALLKERGYQLKNAQAADLFPRCAHVETVVLLSKGEVDSKKIRVEFSLEDMDMSEFQDGATYPQIKEYVLEHTGLKVSNLYISQIKRKCGIEVGKNYNLPKSEDSRQPQCPPEKEKAIREAFKYFGMI
ncbi:MAG: 23S rRNA (uracil(1939)-C(5))-methyltransferase RlmD [Oscillospiraceae bacterium]|nr:23S rRNA (uracil(1939)-C(5))-methyltransferase RlmD [Oscillospiraceae bacterium]